MHFRKQYHCLVVLKSYRCILPFCTDSMQFSVISLLAYWWADISVPVWPFAFNSSLIKSLLGHALAFSSTYLVAENVLELQESSFPWRESKTSCREQVETCSFTPSRLLHLNSWLRYLFLHGFNLNVHCAVLIWALHLALCGGNLCWDLCFLLWNTSFLKGLVTQTARIVTNSLGTPFYLIALNISLVQVGKICRCFPLFYCTIATCLA